MNTKRVILITSLSVFITIAFSINCSTCFGQEKKLEHVTLRMSWIPATDDAFFLIGQEKGFYKKEGIELEILHSDGSSTCVKIIASGANDFGYASADTVLIGRIKGMPLKSIAMFHQTSPVSIFSLKETNITKPQDLIGKKLVSDISSMRHMQFKAFAQKNNIDINKITILPIKGEDFRYLLNKTADAIPAFSYVGNALLRKKGIDINEMNLADYGVDIYGKCMFVHEAVLKEHPELVKRFLRATLRSWKYAIQHHKEAGGVLSRTHPELKEAGEYLLIESLIKFMTNETTKKYGLGYQTKERWDETQDFLFETGLIDKKINIEELYTNEYRK